MHDDKLYEYIKASKLIVIDDNLKIRISEELYKNYENGDYDKDIKNLQECICEVNSVGIKYPMRANPVFYIYIVPDENFMELLNFPFKASGGGCIVASYDLDGFSSAYGRSQNTFLTDSFSISRKVNNIHELAHLVHLSFFSKDRFLSEGFAETFPLYVLGYEDKFDEHRKILKEIDENQILSANELIELGQNGQFHGNKIKDGSCSFEISYISSYLFMRGYLEKLGNKYNLDKVEATQKFLEIMWCTRYRKQFLVWYLADQIEMERDELLNGKNMQLEVLKNL